ncbi:MAG: hypothetical protein QXN16_03740 [Candidatus Micrarchaeaceae archaeon]
METKKQTIVEMRFPIAEEALQYMSLEAKKDQTGTFYQYVFVTDGEPKAALNKARTYLDNLFAGAQKVIIQQIETKQTGTPDAAHIEQVTDIKQYEGEGNV